jgi:hypothetical protein
VTRAEDWKWSSLPGWLRRDPLLWRSGLQVRDKLWLARVNESPSETRPHDSQAPGLGKPGIRNPVFIMKVARPWALDF